MPQVASVVARAGHMVEPSREITQRELRNDSGQILRQVQAGARFLVTRNGTPVAELHPLGRRSFMPKPTMKR